MSWSFPLKDTPPISTSLGDPKKERVGKGFSLVSGRWREDVTVSITTVVVVVLYVPVDFETSSLRETGILEYLPRDNKGNNNNERQESCEMWSAPESVLFTWCYVPPILKLKDEKIGVFVFFSENRRPLIPPLVSFLLRVPFQGFFDTYFRNRGGGRRVRTSTGFRYMVSETLDRHHIWWWSYWWTHYVYTPSRFIVTFWKPLTSLWFRCRMISIQVWILDLVGPINRRFCCFICKWFPEIVLSLWTFYIHCKSLLDFNELYIPWSF